MVLQMLSDKFLIVVINSRYCGLKPSSLCSLLAFTLLIFPPQRDFGPDCRLIERIEENKYNTYASAEWRNKKKHMFVGLNANGKPMKGRKTRRKNTATHFLPIVVQPRWLDMSAMGGRCKTAGYQTFFLSYSDGYIGQIWMGSEWCTEKDKNGNLETFISNG